MSEIQPFTFPATAQQVRVVMIDAEPWFVAADVCTVLGYTNGRDAVAKHVPAAQRGVSRIATPSGEQAMATINEPGLYRLIMRSNRPEAEAFQDWVTGEVLPAIRRTGHYGPLADISTITRRDLAVMLIESEDARELAERRAAELEPDAARARQTLDAHGLSLVRTVAKRFGIQEKALRAFLHAEGLLIRGGACHNEPKACYVKSGHFEVKSCRIEPHPDRPAEMKNTTYITPKGEALIWKRLYQAGLVTSPTMPAEQLQLT